MPLIPSKDEDFLKQKGLSYELVEEGQEIHLILKAWPFPAAYTPRSADILIRILQGYPLTRIDMFYTSPTIMLASGGFPNACQQMVTFGGKTWQQWSRHNDWRAGVDDLRTFIVSMTKEINLGT